MIYTYMKPTSDVVESVESTKSEELVSIVYNEYCNYKEMLESCTDESARPILEAQVEVLYEVSLSDIFEKIKNAIIKICNAIIECFKKVAGFIKRLFTSEKKQNAKNMDSKLNANVVKEIEKALKENASKTVSEATSDPISVLKGIYVSAANHRDLYFDYRNIVAVSSFGSYTINKFQTFTQALSHTTNMDLDEVANAKLLADFGLTKANDKVAGGADTDITSNSKLITDAIKEETAYSVFNKDFCEKYMKGASVDVNEAIQKYLDDRFTKKYTTVKEINAIAYDLYNFGDSECDKLEKAAKEIDNFKKKSISTFSNIIKKSKDEYNNMVRNRYRLRSAKVNNKAINKEINEKINEHDERMDTALKAWKIIVNAMSVSSTYVRALSVQLGRSVKCADSFINSTLKAVKINIEL